MPLAKAVQRASEEVRRDNKEENYWVTELELSALRTLLKAVRKTHPEIRYVGLTKQQLAKLPCGDPGDGGCIGGRCPPCEARWSYKTAKGKRSTR